ncbi:hypothetical protein EYC08_16830 [Tabrizicola sp. WMC-M-20]|nr:hypothetical protein EYC08_16830 [Tabrizicola sp. WMC-M-20]
MEEKEIALKLVLDAIGEDTSISSVDDRVRLQKAVYICQELGIPLGYNYSWYVKGPYSTSLTQDYYSLNSALSSGDNNAHGLALNSSLNDRVAVARSCLALPTNVQVLKHHWLEALCSLHYLLKHSRKSYEEAVTFLGTVKPHLNNVVPVAHARLQSVGLA